MLFSYDLQTNNHNLRANIKLIDTIAEICENIVKQMFISHGYR